jgi:hypothetical protein
MNVEQRLIEVFQTSAHIEPTPDLFTRVVHSIEEDRRHRRRVVQTVATLVGAALALVVAGALSIENGRFGRYVDRPTMEILEVVALTMVLVALGPAIRRFGRGYADDLWPAGAVTPRAILRLLDVAYYLVGAGYILLSTSFDFGDGLLADDLAGQLSAASIRIGGLIVGLGILHATTFVVLPIVAFVDNCTRLGKPLPRWAVLLLILIAVQVLPLVPMFIGIAVGGFE